MNQNKRVYLAILAVLLVGLMFVLNAEWTPEKAQASSGPFAYVTNEGGDEVAVIDTSTNKVVKTIAVGTRPVGVASTPDGATVYVANYGPGVDFKPDTVSVIDTASNTVVETIGVGASPTSVAVTPDGSKAYVTNSISKTISVIDVASNAVVKKIRGLADFPVWVVISPDGLRAYVSATAGNDKPDPGTLVVINTQNNKVLDTITIGVDPRHLVVTPDGSTVYVANKESHSVSVVNTESFTVVKTIAVGLNPVGVVVTPDGTTVYVTNKGSNSVTRINTADNKVVGNPIPVGQFPVGAAITQDGSTVYVANKGTAQVSSTVSDVSVIVTSTNTVVTTIVDVGINPFGIAIVVPGAPPPPPPPPSGISVDTITPNIMMRGTSIDDVTLSGSGFVAGADVTFENGSGPAPTSSNVVVVDENTIKVTVTAGSGGPPRNRVWDVRVTNSDASTGVLEDGFTVTQ